MDNTLTLRQNKIVLFLDLKETHNHAPDLLEIINFIGNQGKEDSVGIVKDVKTLQQKLKIMKVRSGFTTTYRLIRNL